MKCQDFRELIDSYLCDELLTETNHEVLRHLEQCANCRNVIEERRIFRARLRSAVQNCEEFKICENFRANLQRSLEKAGSPERNLKKPFLLSNYSWVGVAAGFLVIAVFGIWIFQNQNVNNSTDRAANIQKKQSVYLQNIALGDHKNCVVDHKLTESPVKIDLQSPQYASLRDGVMMPLKKEFGKCELVESHICKYEGHAFTHLVFNYEGKMMSVLMMDLQNYEALENSYIAKMSEDDYQVARFDLDKKAVFVVSNMSEQKNTIAAEVLEIPLREQFLIGSQASLISFADYRR